MNSDDTEKIGMREAYAWWSNWDTGDDDDSEKLWRIVQ